MRHDLLNKLTARLKRKADRNETCTTTVNLLGTLLGMVVTAWVKVLEFAGDRKRITSDGDHISMCGDNVAAVSRVNRCGGAKRKRACRLMRMLIRLEIEGRWSQLGRHMPGVQDTFVADGISIWPRSELISNVRELTHSTDWSARAILRARGNYCLCRTRNKMCCQRPRGNLMEPHGRRNTRGETCKRGHTYRDAPAYKLSAHTASCRPRRIREQGGG